MRILTVNAGSTSMKLFLVADGAVTDAWDTLDDALEAARSRAPDAVAHRVVHGGDRVAPVVVDDAVLGELRALTDLAPLHQPPALDALERCRRDLPNVPSVACFDTAFHATIPEAARTYALPARYRERVRVYGFHGLACASVARTVARLAPGTRRLLIAHLGGGQSLTAVLDGCSVMTTMGFTPLDGLVMATRSGSLDPGAVLWLAEHHPDDDLTSVLEHESGLAGLAGTDDFRTVRAGAARGDADATLALEVWRHRLVTLAGACVAALGGLDAVAFSGGIGEHDAATWRDLADGLSWLGVRIADPPQVAAGEPVEITGPHSGVRVFVVPAHEELELAAEAAALVREAPSA